MTQVTFSHRFFLLSYEWGFLLPLILDFEIVRTYMKVAKVTRIYLRLSTCTESN